jgi:integrase
LKWTELEALWWLYEFLNSHIHDEIFLDERQIKHIKARRLKVEREKFFLWFEEVKENTAYSIKFDLRNYFLGKCEKLMLMVGKALTMNKNDDIEYYCFHVNLANLFKEAECYGVFDNHSRTETGRWAKHWDNNPRTKMIKKTDRSKRNTSNRLPNDWQEMIAERMEFPEVIDLFILTGLRAAEVNSVTMSLTQCGNLEICIKTAKTPRGNPPRFRRLTIDKSHPSAKRLIAVVDKCDFSTFQKESFRQQLGRVSQKLFGIRISPRNFRHEIAAIIKTTDGPMTTRGAATLGHGSTRTFCGYGSVRGKSRVPYNLKLDPIISAESTEVVRETRSVKYLSPRQKLSVAQNKKAEPEAK